jgi:hypothetical protein
VSESTIKGAIAEAAITAPAIELCQELRRCFCVPIAHAAGRTGMHLRLRPAANNQRTAINFAADHDFGAIAQLGERRHGMAEAGGSSPPSSTSNVRPLR